MKKAFLMLMFCFLSLALTPACKRKDSAKKPRKTKKRRATKTRMKKTMSTKKMAHNHKPGEVCPICDAAKRY